MVSPVKNISFPTDCARFKKQPRPEKKKGGKAALSNKPLMEKN